ncbi:MAG: hypothetical protein OQK82_07305, partial [Candidatus Pacearchaeota archaeon]|nr:hypothetical protein [Candidatus Pacearchaeota archaeon]
GLILSLKGDDNFAGLKSINCSLDGLPYEPYTEPFSFAGEQDDALLIFYGEDYLGLCSSVIGINVAIDDTPPVTQMATNLPLIDVNGNLHADSRYIFTWIPFDGKSGIAQTIIIIDGEQMNPGELTFSFIEDGEHIIEYYSIDNLKNTEETNKITIITPIPDMTPPVSTIESSYIPYNDENMDYFRSDVTFIIKSEDIIGQHESYSSGVDTIFFSVDGSVYDEYTGREITVSGEGLHEISFYANDSAGNIEPEQSYFFTIDNTPPESSVVVIDSENNVIDQILYLTESEKIEIISIDTDCGVNTIYWRLSLEDEWQLFEEPFAIKTGSYSIEYYAVDNLGNSEEIKNIKIKVITDYNIISYKTDISSIKPGAIKGYDVCNSKIAYLRGSQNKTDIFVKDITELKESIFCHGTKISLKSQKIASVSISQDYIVTSEIRNKAQDIYLYDIDTSKQEGENLSYYGTNIKPVIIDDMVYWIQIAGNTNSVVEYNITQRETNIIFSVPSSISNLKKVQNHIVFMAESDESRDIYAYKDNEITMIYENIFSVSSSKVVNFALYSNLLAIEMLEENGNNIYIYSLSDLENILITKIAGKNPKINKDYIFYTKKIKNTEILTLYNIINNVETSMVKGTELEHIILLKNEDILVERKSRKGTGKSTNKKCSGIQDYTELLYLKKTETEPLVKEITYSSGTNNFTYNKYFDKEDFIYADMDISVDGVSSGISKMNNSKINGSKNTKCANKNII